MAKLSSLGLSVHACKKGLNTTPELCGDNQMKKHVAHSGHSINVSVSLQPWWLLSQLLICHCLFPFPIMCLTLTKEPISMKRFLYSLLTMLHSLKGPLDADKSTEIAASKAASDLHLTDQTELCSDTPLWFLQHPAIPSIHMFCINASLPAHVTQYTLSSLSASPRPLALAGHVPLHAPCSSCSLLGISLLPLLIKFFSHIHISWISIFNIN